MRKTLAILLALVLALALCACGITKENVPLKYGETYTVEPESLENFDTLVWTSADEAVATVDGGKIKAVGPGSAVVTAADADGKAVAEYTVEVEIVPVTSIVLSTNACEVAEGESFQLNYTLFPDDASDYGLNWKSADESVAKVSPDGKITGVAVGQTTISISNKEGFMATCSVTVKKALPNFKELYGKWENERWFTVSDDGPGVEPQHLEHLFERFYRIDKGRSRKLGGTGLGLAIVKNAVAAHGGTATALATRGGGLTIRFTLARF